MDLKFLENENQEFKDGFLKFAGEAELEEGKAQKVLDYFYLNKTALDTNYKAEMEKIKVDTEKSVEENISKQLVEQKNKWKNEFEAFVSDEKVKNNLKEFEKNVKISEDVKKEFEILGIENNPKIAKLFAEIGEKFNYTPASTGAKPVTEGVPKNIEKEILERHGIQW
jgi:hypothetical protein